MKVLKIKIIEWGDIKQWWKSKREPSEIRKNAKDAVDYVEERWKSMVEKVIEVHYPGLGCHGDMARYNALIYDLKDTIHGICYEAKKFI